MRARFFVAATVVLAVPIALAAPVAANATPAVVTTFSDLQTAVTASGTSNATVTLGADITAGAAQYLDVTGDTVTVDLNGYTLTITNPDHDGGEPAVLVPTGASLTVEDTAGGGQLTATGGLYAAGIGGAIGGSTGGSAGAITITGGTITATGGPGGAGIGGGKGATLDATPAFGGAGGTITITGGTITATGGGNGAGIGGGEGYADFGIGSGGAGGTTTIQGTPTTGSSTEGGSSSNGGIGATFTNSVEPAGVSYTATSTDGDNGSTKIVFHYLVTINPGNGDPATTQTIDTGGVATAPTLTRAGYTFVGWQVGSAPFSFSTPITSPVSVTATWKAVLASTGVDPTLPAGLAALLLLVGAALLITRRRTQHS